MHLVQRRSTEDSGASETSSAMWTLNGSPKSRHQEMDFTTQTFKAHDPAEEQQRDEHMGAVRTEILFEHFQANALTTQLGDGNIEMRCEDE